MHPAAGRRNGYRRLTGVERMYLALESPVTPMHFAALAIVDAGAPRSTLLDADGRLRLAEVRRTLDERARAIPDLRRVIRPAGPLAGPPLWVDDPAFRIERHVGAVAMPAGHVPDHARGGAANGVEAVPVDEALLRFADRQMAPLLDRAGPLWRVWFITGLADRRVAVLIEIHHALADGMTAMRLARTLLSPARSVTSAGWASTLLSTTSAPPPGWTDLVLDHGAGLVAAARAIARPSTAHAVMAAARSFWAGATAATGEPRTGLNTPVGPRRRTVAIPFDMATVKRVARTHGVGANDVVLAVIAAGLRALLASRGVPIECFEPRVGVAVALPASASPDDGGNRFGSYVLGLPVSETDPLVRLTRVARERDRAKRTQAVDGVTAVRAWTARWRPTRALMARQRVINLMETYLPGPPSVIDVLGAPVLDLIPLQPLGRNVGLTFIASTYAGRLTLTVRTDPDAFPDLDVLLSAIEREWAAIRSATMAPAALASTETLVPTG